jgi:hypothetical protein
MACAQDVGAADDRLEAFSAEMGTASPADRFGRIIPNLLASRPPPGATARRPDGCGLLPFRRCFLVAGT